MDNHCNTSCSCIHEAIHALNKERGNKMWCNDANAKSMFVEFNYSPTHNYVFHKN